MSHSRSPSWKKEVIRVKSQSEERRSHPELRVKFADQRKDHERGEGEPRRSALKGAGIDPAEGSSSSKAPGPETPARELAPRAVELKPSPKANEGLKPDRNRPTKGQGAKGKEKGKGKGKWQMWKAKKKKQKWNPKADS